jgi:hypothetical protein
MSIKTFSTTNLSNLLTRAADSSFNDAIRFLTSHSHSIINKLSTNEDSIATKAIAAVTTWATLSALLSYRLIVGRSSSDTAHKEIIVITGMFFLPSFTTSFVLLCSLTLPPPPPPLSQAAIVASVY